MNAKKISVLVATALAIVLLYQIGQTKLALKQVSAAEAELKSTTLALERAEQRAGNAEKKLLINKSDQASVAVKETEKTNNSLLSSTPQFAPPQFSVPPGPPRPTMRALPGGDEYDRARAEASHKEQALARIEAVERVYEPLYPRLGIVTADQESNFLKLLVGYEQGRIAGVQAALIRTLLDPNAPGKPIPDVASEAVQMRKEAAVKEAQERAFQDFVSRVQENFGAEAANIVNELKVGQR